MPDLSSRPQAGRKFGALLSFIAVSTITGVVGAGLAIPAVGAVSAGADTGIEIFEALPAALEEGPLAQQSTMVANDGSTIAKFYWENRIEKPLDKMSQDVQDASVAIEDYRFFDHGGVDLNGIARAAVHNILSPSTQGASTLTQQYVKNVLIEASHQSGDDEGIAEATQSEGSSGIARKMREAKLAIAVEKKYSKKEILERYLNINNYGGSPRQYGVEAAAQHYWGVSAKDLNLQQSALLAGVVQNPSANNPEANPEQALQRRNIVLNSMLKHGKITQEEHDKAAESELDLDIHNVANGCQAAGVSAFFCDYVQRTIETDKTFGKTLEDRRNFLIRGGLQVKTTLDPDMQKAAAKAVTKRVPAKDASGAGHTIVTVEPGTGKVLSMAQNRKYSTSEDAGKSETNINYNVDKQFNGGTGFQPGSTWKPFVLAAWLKSGRQLNDSVNGGASKYFGFRTSSCDGRNYATNGYGPKNAGDSGGANGSMSVLNATKKSVNKAYADMASELDMCKIRDTAMDLGVHLGTGEALDKESGPGDTQEVLYPASILGSLSIAPITMAAAFATFAADGEYCKPTPIDSIKDRNGKQVDVPDADCHRALSKDVARGVTYALTQTFNGGTTNGLQIGVPAGAKTGTANLTEGHSWLVGFTKTMSTAVWTGDPDGQRDWRKNSKGSVRGTVYGATISGQTWSAYMKKAVKYTKGNTSFPRPPGSVMGSSPSPKSSSPKSSGSSNNDSGPSKKDDSDSKKKDDSGKKKDDSKSDGGIKGEEKDD
ncbi:transglycosylase domain-containing protein [Saxibacter everestensis]|uniref:Transglycosylase domain-containing protein n=1 Tax=Saxibacter everestensis TaxID=2909229 RepID=A0ABY8QRY3_9MICO|nr:transglycosylase domain-containing protein [Brevibacteriaceae bacterium ZFBP1038]